MRFRPSALLVGLAALVVSACAPTQEPVSYLLDAQARPVGELAGAPIGLREISLPLYARRAQIATLGPGGEITLSDDHKWAEEQLRATSRLVARELTADLNRPVVIEPWPRGVTPETRVDIDVDYFIGALGGEVRLGGQYRLVDARNPAAASIRSFDISEPLSEASYGELVAGHNRALTRLANEIARDFTRQSGS